MERATYKVGRVTMGLAALQTKKFSSAEELCAFVNYNEISVIVQIVVKDDLYVLYYR